MRVRFGPVLQASFCLALAGPVPALAAKKALALEAIAAGPPLVSRGAAAGSWRAATHLTFTLPDEAKHDDPSPLCEVDAKTGKRIKLIEPLAIQPRTIPEKTLPFTGASWSPDGRTLLLTGDKDLWLYDVAKKDLRRVTRDENEEEAASFSPDGRLVAFVRKNDLYVLEVASGKEARLTSTGTETRLNGVLDWVYEEELANRKSRRAYAFSPDSASIVYLSLDDAHVPEYPIVDYVPTHGKVRLQRYPKAGDPNPVASVHIVDVAKARPVANVSWNGEDLYAGWQFTWLPDSSAACYVVLDRTQKRLEAHLLPRDGTPGRRILAESDEAWINSIDQPHFFRDGSGFLFISQRTGF